LAAVAVAGGMLGGAPSAWAGAATWVTLGSAGNNAGLLVGDNVATTLGNTVLGGSGTRGTFGVSGGTIDIGTNNASSNPNYLHDLTATGLIEGGFGSGCNPGSPGSCGASTPTGGSNNYGTLTLNPGLFSTSTAGDPIADALTAAMKAGGGPNGEDTLNGGTNNGYNGSNANPTINHGSVMCTTAGSCLASTLTLDATDQLADNVFDITDLDLDGGNCLNIDDGSHAGAKFVINVTGKFIIGAGGCINLLDATKASDVIFNIEGTGQTVSITGGGGTIEGTILAANRSVTVNNASITGEIIAGIGNLGSGYTVQADNSTVTFAAYTPPPRLPEPASLVLFGTGVAVVAAIRKRRATPPRL
jgi:choice-of-anchor A domain-containing protein